MDADRPVVLTPAAELAPPSPSAASSAPAWSVLGRELIIVLYAAVAAFAGAIATVPGGTLDGAHFESAAIAGVLVALARISAILESFTTTGGK